MQTRLTVVDDFIVKSEDVGICPSRIDYLIPILNNITVYETHGNYIGLAYDDYAHIITDPAKWVNPGSNSSGICKTLFKNLKQR